MRHVVGGTPSHCDLIYVNSRALEFDLCQPNMWTIADEWFTSKWIKVQFDENKSTNSNDISQAVLVVFHCQKVAKIVIRILSQTGQGTGQAIEIVYQIYDASIRQNATQN